MQIIVGIVGLIFAFCLGYLTSQYDISGHVIREFLERHLSSNQKGIFLVVFCLIVLYIFIVIPLERIASIEAKKVRSKPLNWMAATSLLIFANMQSNGYPFRTSAREHLQRRGSF
ncbi:hypothetical protein INT43_003378 [Umbelopsis isabellina]|uniref:Uncharacterized protein n=1 Tax=Mortierella isabellina TaxID=91625 RepID=A0A8H7PQW8_MORIS|nr:hypothetical protein INT43_003378 [Umbelopsis isabellina]